MEQLLRFSIFREFQNDSQIAEELGKQMKREVFQPRDFIIDEKKTDSKMFFLTSGQVEINKISESGQIVVLGRVDARSNPCFGESSLIGEHHRSANVVAYSQCECLSVEAKTFEAFMRKHPRIAISVYRTLAKILFERLAKADRDILIAGIELKK